MREAHAAGRLIDDLNAAMERRARATPRPGDDYDLRVMAQFMKHRLPIWEEVLIRPGEPWRPYFTPRARLGARRAIEDARAYMQDL
jgi:hypothetical protein